MPVGGGALSVADPVVSSSDSADSSREALDQLLDAVLYAPVGLLLSTDTSSKELAARGRRRLEAARLLGRMALGHSTAPPASRSDPADPEPG